MISHVRSWPALALCLILGATGAMVATTQLHGQAVKPLDKPNELTSFREIVKRVVPAVVSIEAKADVSKRQQVNTQPRAVPQLPPGVPEEFRRFFEMMPQNPGSRAPQPSPNLGFGSGVLISADGVVLTNFHVVDGADSVEVTLQDGRSFTSTDIHRDAKTDLAVVKLDGAGKSFPFLTFADSSVAEVGDRVLAVGAPFGLTGSVTHGIISAKSRQNLHLNQYEDFIQTDAAINPGNSGGPLVDLNGRIVGINSAIKTRSGGFQGIGLAISSNLARDVADQLMKSGVVRRGYLGVGIRGMSDDLAKRLGVEPDTGVLVTKVYEDSPAGKAGIQAGDVITKVGDQTVKEWNAIPRLVAKLPVGKATDFTYIRDGKSVTVAVTIEEQPQEFGIRTTSTSQKSTEPRTTKNKDYGLSVATLTATNGQPLGYASTASGVLVVSVEPSGAAADAGLRAGLVITKVDKTAVATADAFFAALKAADAERGALLQILRPSGEVDFAVLKLQ
ncbi:MAG: Do family serine endopeptidase [Bacteroidales bacterium]|nr:Do family serine endopeptidase [Bacteroidales bacterium]